MSSVLKHTRYTEAEYLAIERSATCKSEFQLYAMTDASREHNLITVSIAGELRSQLKRRPCEAYMNDIRVKAAEAQLPLS
ncbi:MAG: hypothetical protein PHG00_17515 [Methylococcales bacterium]|nr:hypothetical protein [Methylococcales bacterium]